METSGNDVKRNSYRHAKSLQPLNNSGNTLASTHTSRNHPVFFVQSFQIAQNLYG